jgi:Trk K+ transport system NAD-binding subunit
MAGARAAMEHFGVPDVNARVERYAAGKQEHVIKLIEQGRFMAFPDALRFILAVKAMGIRVAAASSSKNAGLFLERIRLDSFAAEQRLDYDFIHDGMTLQELFDADHLSDRRPGAGRPTGRLFRGRGRHQRDPGRQSSRDGRARGGPPRRRAAAGGGGR